MFSPIKLLPMLSLSTKITSSTKVRLWGCFLHPPHTNTYRHTAFCSLAFGGRAKKCIQVECEHIKSKTLGDKHKKLPEKKNGEYINARKVELVIVVSITVERSKWTDQRNISLENVHDYILWIVVSIWLCIFDSLSFSLRLFFLLCWKKKCGDQCKHSVCNKINKKELSTSCHGDRALHNRARFKYLKSQKQLAVYVCTRQTRKKNRKISIGKRDRWRQKINFYGYLSENGWFFFRTETENHHDNNSTRWSLWEIATGSRIQLNGLFRAVAIYFSAFFDRWHVLVFIRLLSSPIIASKLKMPTLS